MAHLYTCGRGGFVMTAPHTAGICHELQRATEAVERGECYYVIVTCPPQHGKSTICSEVFPGWFLGRNPDLRVLLASYSGDLAQVKSREARRLIQTPEVAETFDIELDPSSHAVDDWQLKGYSGGMTAVGLGGTITGRGASVILIDDYCKGRAEAESSTMRQKVWESFQNDLMTRRSPAHAVVIIATRWHQDDLIGRIQEQMKADARFPQFKFVEFPAHSPEYGWLFAPRFSAEFYESTRVLIGPYAWAALYMCTPTPRAGGLLQTSAIDWRDEDTWPAELSYVRFWDVASSQKERVGENPDWTVGTKLAVTRDPADARVLHIWVRDVKRIREEAPERNRVIVGTAHRDGRGVPVGIEQVGAYKDTVIIIRGILKGLAKVIGVGVTQDKVLRAEPLEPILESGHVHCLRAAWNDAWVQELDGFPNGTHDDQVDSLSGGGKMACERHGIMFAPMEQIVSEIRAARGDLDTSAAREFPATPSDEPGARVSAIEITPPTGDEVEPARDRIMGDDRAWR